MDMHRRLLVIAITITVTFCGAVASRYAVGDEFDPQGGVFLAAPQPSGVNAQSAEPAAQASSVGWWDWDDAGDEGWGPMEHADYRKGLPVVQNVRTYSVAGEDFQRRVTWAHPALAVPDKSVRDKIWEDYRVTGYVVKCKPARLGFRGTRVAIALSRHATEAVVGTALLGWNRGMVNQATYRCGVAVKTTKGLGRFVYAEKTFIAGPQPPPPGATAVLTNTYAASTWLVSGWTAPAWGPLAFRLQCVPSGGGCNGAGAVSSPILTGAPATGTFETLLGLRPGTAYDCYVVSYEDSGATVPFVGGGAGVCSSPPTSFTTIAYSTYSYTLGALGGNNGATGQDNFWTQYEIGVADSPVVPGTDVTAAAAFEGSNSLKVGNCGTSCSFVNWVLHPMQPAGTAIDAGGWPAAGYAGKPSTGAPANRARMSVWVRTLSTSLPITPQQNPTTTDLSFSFEGLATEVMTWIGARIFNNVPSLGNGVPFAVAVGWTGAGATGTQTVDYGPALTPGAWYNLVTNAEFNDGQYNDRVVYQVFDAAGAKLWEVAVNSWEAPHFLFRPGYGVPTQIPIVRRFQMRNRLGNTWTNADGGLFVDKLEVATWNSAAPTALLYQYATSFEGAAV